MTEDEHFQRTLAVDKEARSIAEPYDKRILEFEKAAVEFSKIVLTILYSINAGGLVAIPAVLSFLGLGTEAARFTVLAVCAGGFGAGLISAAMCAYAAHLNYRAHSDFEFNVREAEIFKFYQWTSRYGLKTNEAIHRNDERLKRRPLSVRWINISNVLGHSAGWLSLICFISSCIWVAYQFR